MTLFFSYVSSLVLCQLDIAGDQAFKFFSIHQADLRSTAGFLFNAFMNIQSAGGGLSVPFNLLEHCVQ